MFRQIINVLPLWQIFTIIFILLAGISILATYLGSRVFHREKYDKQYSRTSDNVLYILGSAYGVFLSFVIITLWNHYLNVQKMLYREADNISILTRHLEVFPPNQAKILRKSIKDYVNAVRNDEWSKMHQGTDSDLAWAAMNNLFQAYQNYAPITSNEKTFYSHSISHLNELLKERRDRVIAIDSIINTELRAALMLGAVVILLLSSILKAQEGGIRLFANICLAMVFSFNLALALTLEYPFSGSISVSDAPLYQGILATL